MEDTQERLAKYLAGWLLNKIRKESQDEADYHAFTAPICDFCSAPNPPHVYQARDTKLGKLVNPYGGSLTFNSVGEWMACDECKKCIDTGNRPELTERGMRNPSLQKLPEDARRKGIVDIHDAFFAAKI